MEKLEVERVMPYKSMEEKLLKHKRELENKYKEDLESEIQGQVDWFANSINFDYFKAYVDHNYFSSIK